MKVAIYLRVSTKNKGQDVNTQLIPIKEYCLRSGFEIYKVYSDIGESGSKESRPEFDIMLKDLRNNKFKAIAVYKLDRIGRSMQHLLKLFEEFNKRGIEFISLTQNIDTTTPEGRMFLKMLMVLGEYERDLIVNRVNDGIRRAKELGTRSGKAIGRPTIDADVSEVIKLKESGLSLRQISKQLNLSLGKVQRCIKTHGAQIDK